VQFSKDFIFHSPYYDAGYATPMTVFAHYLQKTQNYDVRNVTEYVR